MIDIPCIVSCDECGVRKDAFLRRTRVTAGFMTFMPGSPSEELVFPGEATTNWTLDRGGRVFCSAACAAGHQAKQDKERAERAAKEKRP